MVYEIIRLIILRGVGYIYHLNFKAPITLLETALLARGNYGLPIHQYAAFFTVQAKTTVLEVCVYNDIICSLPHIPYSIGVSHIR